jgi:hypothetical protein
VARRHATYVVSTADPEVKVLAEDESSPARALAALQVLSGRRLAALQLRQAGAHVIEAPPDELGARCLNAYFTAKLRARI